MVLIVLTVASCFGAGAQQIAYAEAFTPVEFCPGQTLCPGKNRRIKNVKILQQAGARPRWSPQGDAIVFDRQNADGYYDVYLTTFRGSSVISLTENKPGIGQKNNGNAIFHPPGNYIVFISEEEDHLGERSKWLADPGLGLFSNLWVTNRSGDRFWKLTNIPAKKRLLDKIPAMGVVNPNFSLDGTVLVWTERYAAGGHHNWGLWRLMTAKFSAINHQPKLDNPQVLFLPKKGNYVTSMGFIDAQRLLLAGNLEGQHEYGMDQYVYNIRTGELINLQNSPSIWEEGACMALNGRYIVYMSNAASKHQIDFNNPDWPTQPTERDYWVMDIGGKNKERLTYFNDPSAPEYLGKRVIVAACGLSPDGRFLAGSLGVDFGNERRARLQLKIVLLEFEEPLK